MKKKFYLTTTTEGCATNLLENSSYRMNLELNEFEGTRNIDESDVVIINTCAYTTNQEERSLKYIEEMFSKYPHKKILVGGCLTKINPKGLSEIYHNDYFEPGDTSKLLKLLDIKNESPIVKAHYFNSDDFNRLTSIHALVLKIRPIYFKFEKIFNKKFQPLHNILETTIINEEYFTISVSTGCLGKCSFCSIKEAKGTVKSIPVAQILHEFQTGIDRGFKKFWLLGDDIGCYGEDIGTNAAVLLQEILKIRSGFSLVVNYFEPHFLLKHSEKMIDVLQDKRIKNINFPIQSGSQRIIKRMGREYNIEEVFRVIKKIKRIRPDLVLKTNIIIGFPGEKLKDLYNSTKALLSFNAILCIKFTPRPGTGAFNYKNQLPDFKKKLYLSFINFFVILRHSYIAIKAIIFPTSLSKRPYGKEIEIGEVK